jgi:hypothetical protein
VAHNFQTGKNKIKLLTEYESVTQKVLFSVELILQNVKQLQHAHLSWHVRCPNFLDSINIFLRSARSSRSFFGAEHYQSLETVLVNDESYYLKVDFFHVEFCNDVAF